MPPKKRLHLSFLLPVGPSVLLCSYPLLGSFSFSALNKESGFTEIFPSSGEVGSTQATSKNLSFRLGSNESPMMQMTSI
jgi:hypothetical protein